MVEKVIYTEFKKDWLVNVPVKTNIWIRPECQRRQFEVIKQARPNILFLSSDGGRNDQEWEAIRTNRQLFDSEIDWNCTIYKIYMDKNYGLYEMGKIRKDIIWDNVDRCIFMEDDQVPAVSFFRYCEELLKKYENDERISVICGNNILGSYERPNADYFFSTKGSIWGYATWRRVATTRDEEYGFYKDPYIMDLLKEQTKRDKTCWKRINSVGSKGMYNGHTPGGEFYHDFDSYALHRLQIIPTKNMISNIGSTANATNADSLNQLPKGIRSVFNSPVYEIEFPLRHPAYIIPDMEFAKKRNRILAYGHPFIRKYRTLVRGIKKLLKGDINYIFLKIKYKFFRHK